MASQQLPPIDRELRERMHTSSRALTRLGKVHLVLLWIQMLPLLLAALGVLAVVVVVAWLLLFG